MKGAMRAERAAMEAEAAAEMAETRSAHADECAAAAAIAIVTERHARQRQEMCYREDAAAALWEEHIAHARLQLQQRDAELLATEGPSFWSKVRPQPPRRASSRGCSSQLPLRSCLFTAATSQWAVRSRLAG